jgi:hypothetical protein
MGRLAGGTGTDRVLAGLVTGIDGVLAGFATGTDAALAGATGTDGVLGGFARPLTGMEGALDGFAGAATGMDEELEGVRSGSAAPFDGGTLDDDRPIASLASLLLPAVGTRGRLVLLGAGGGSVENSDNTWPQAEHLAVPKEL